MEVLHGDCSRQSGCVGGFLQDRALEAFAPASTARAPTVKFCLERGLIERATVVDHVEPHKGDWTAFCTGKLQSLCEPCHNSAKQQIELRGYRCDIGVDGLPTDPNHPFNRAG